MRGYRVLINEGPSVAFCGAHLLSALDTLDAKAIRYRLEHDDPETCKLCREANNAV